MPLIAIVVFVVCVVLFVVLANILANRKQIKAAFQYGQTHFDIEVPESVSVQEKNFHKLSDAEAFFVLITPYLKDLSSEKRRSLKDHIVTLKENLKISPAIYDRFSAEYDKAS